MSKLISLTQGKTTLVDDADFETLSRHKWYARQYCDRWYAVREVRKHGAKRLLFMHRSILKPPAGMETDHKDHNGLNNRRYNLRAATHAQNACNRKKQKGTSQFKGVSWYRRHAKWQARIMIDRKTIHLGYFNSEIEAAKAYDAAAIKYFGEFACLNFKIAS